ncbi:hypothetical protein AN958_08162 [Leucoagaricus sp. SymC.cos]|nr:hypothetical protein AN958_08162 [Leucoagaricus sp. SymC.cos]
MTSQSQHRRYPSSSPSQTSSRSLSSGHSHSGSGSSINHPPPVPFQLHPSLRTTQEVVAHGIRSYILWDIREHPRTARAVHQLPLALSPELLNSYATNPPVAFLNVKGDYPKPWSTVVYASAAVAGGVPPPGSRSTFPVYPPPPPSHGGFPRVPSNTSRRFSASGAPNNAGMGNTFSYPTPPAPHSRAVGVTIADLLHAIYNHLHSESVSIRTFNALQPKQQTRVLDAYEKRRNMTQGVNAQYPMSAPAHFSSFPPSMTATSNSGSAVEGIKLVDTFLLHTMFAGLEVDLENSYTVILTVKRPN